MAAISVEQPTRRQRVRSVVFKGLTSVTICFAPGAVNPLNASRIPNSKFQIIDFIAAEALDERTRIRATAKRVGLARRIHGHQGAIDRVAIRVRTLARCSGGLSEPA